MGKGKVRTVVKEDLALVLASLGLTVRQSRTVINVVINSMKEALKRHESVDLEFGRLVVVKQTQQRRRRWRFGQPQEVFRQRYRVVFQPPEER